MELTGHRAILGIQTETGSGQSIAYACTKLPTLHQWQLSLLLLQELQLVLLIRNKLKFAPSSPSYGQTEEPYQAPLTA